jgi:DNA-binding transcriptional LysR family regulator
MLKIDSGIDLPALRALVTIADAGSFRAAATALGYSQSAVSHRIAALERGLGTELFDRPGGRGAVRLTAAGQAAYTHARRAIAAAEALEADVGARGGETRTTLRVGVFQTAAAELLPQALRAFRRDWPRVEVILTENDRPDRLTDQLARGRLDLAFARDVTSDDRVEAIPLLDDPLVILTRRDSPLLTLDDATFDVLDGADVVAWTRRWPMQLELEAAWRRRGIAPRVVFRTEDNLALQRLVAAGLGDACIGRLAAQHALDPALAWIAPAESLIDRRIVLLSPRHREPSAAALTLIETIRGRLGA